MERRIISATFPFQKRRASTKTRVKSISNTMFLLGMMLFASEPVPISAEELSPKERLGKSIFFDDNLSFGGNQSCAKSLKSIVHFYNTRDVKNTCADPFTEESDALARNCRPKAEVLANVNTEELGNLGLTPGEEDAIVAYLLTLSDGYVPSGK